MHNGEVRENPEQRIEYLKELVTRKGDERRAVYGQIQELKKQRDAMHDKWSTEESHGEIELDQQIKTRWKEFEVIEAELRPAWDQLESLMGGKKFSQWLESRETKKSES